MALQCKNSRLPKAMMDTSQAPGSSNYIFKMLLCHVVFFTWEFPCCSALLKCRCDWTWQFCLPLFLIQLMSGILWPPLKPENLGNRNITDSKTMTKTFAGFADFWNISFPMLTGSTLGWQFSLLKISNTIKLLIWIFQAKDWVLLESLGLPI